MCTKFLLEYKASPTILDVDGFAPLHVATSVGAIDIVKLLLSYGASPIQIKKVKNSVRTEIIQYWTPIHLAVAHNYPDILRLFFNNEEQIVADPSVPNNTNITPLHLAASQKNSEILDILLEEHADIEAIDNDQDPPLFTAIQARLLSNAEKLCNSQTVIMADIRGDTALHLACCYGYSEFVKFLIEQNSNLLACDEQGNTPLHVAVIHRHQDCVKILLENGADPVVRNNDNQSPFVLASGEIASMIRNYIEKNKETVCAERVEKLNVSTKVPPSRLRERLSPSQMQRTNNYPTSPSRLKERRNDSSSVISRGSTKSKDKKQALIQSEPKTIGEYEKRIEDIINQTKTQLKQELDEVRQLIMNLKEDMQAQDH